MLWNRRLSKIGSESLCSLPFRICGNFGLGEWERGMACYAFGIDAFLCAVSFSFLHFVACCIRCFGYDFRSNSLFLRRRRKKGFYQCSFGTDFLFFVSFVASAFLFRLFSYPRFADTDCISISIGYVPASCGAKVVLPCA